MPRTLIGAKIRDRRRTLGLTQARLAATLGISPSYLNLIESNKRSIGGRLLKRMAETLEIALEDLDGAAERRLIGDLEELAAEPMLADLHLDPSGAADFAGRHPDWARALIRLHRAWRDRGEAVNALSDRLNQDPFLGDAVRSVLGRVAAIRSSSEILETVDDIEPRQHQRFVSIIAAESRRLTDVAQALAAYFDRAHVGTRPITPVEEVDDFLFERNNHFPALEQAAAALRADAGIDGVCRESTLVEYLGRAHGVRVAAAPESGRHEDAFDLASRTLVLADTAPRATRRFALARLAAALFREGRPVEEALAASSLLSSEAARRRARRALWSYLAAALLMPYEEFLAAARRARYDIDYLAQRFEASYEQVCHRLVTLRRPGASGVPFGLMRIDPAGFLTKRFPLPHLPLPRHGNACPLWAGYEAFQTPGATVRQIAAFPTGERFLFLARAIEKTRPSFTLPRRLISIMLACDVLHADQIVYADGLNLSSSAPTTPVGSNCRLCVRRDCDYREEDPIIDA